MSREKEIIEAGIEYTMKNRPNVLAGDKFSEEMKIFNRNKAFEEGAKWADNTMIDKACEILNSMLYMRDCIYYKCVSSPHHATIEEFINEFKKLMEK